jgi:hypothetical protein
MRPEADEERGSPFSQLQSIRGRMLYLSWWLQGLSTRDCWEVQDDEKSGSVH